MITKDLSRKKVIILMNTNNAKIFIAQFNVHIANINRLLKEIKLEISTNYIHSNNKRIVIITNKVAISFDLNIVKKYIKELNNVNSNNIMSLRLLQSKFDLKILDILYFIDNTNLPVMPDIIESVIKSTHIFNDIVLAFHPCVIKASPKSDMVMV